MAAAAVLSAAMNVRINLQDMAQDGDAIEMLERADRAVHATRELARRVEAEVWSVLGGDVSVL
jgi:hypothetical protein